MVETPQKKGGDARAAKLSPDQRKQIASEAARARWDDAGKLPGVDFQGDVKLGNFEVHIFDASKGPRAADPHHTLNIPWQEQAQALKMLQEAGAMVEKIRPHRGTDNYSINVFDPDGNRWELSFAKEN